MCSDNFLQVGPGTLILLKHFRRNFQAVKNCRVITPTESTADFVTAEIGHFSDTVHGETPWTHMASPLRSIARYIIGQYVKMSRYSADYFVYCVCCFAVNFSVDFFCEIPCIFEAFVMRLKQNYVGCAFLSARSMGRNRKSKTST